MRCSFFWIKKTKRELLPTDPVFNLEIYLHRIIGYAGVSKHKPRKISANNIVDTDKEVEKGMPQARSGCQ